MTFRLAMSPSILALTAVLFVLPRPSWCWPPSGRRSFSGPRSSSSRSMRGSGSATARPLSWCTRGPYLWTTNRGLVRMYVSRTDRFVWIERKSDRPWLITPDQPSAFVRALSARD